MLLLCCRREMIICGLRRSERSMMTHSPRFLVSDSRSVDITSDREWSYIHNPQCSCTHHAALPVDGEEAGAALQSDDALPEVVPADLEPQPQHRGEGVVVLLADLLRPQVVIPGLAKVGQLWLLCVNHSLSVHLLLVDEPGEVGWRVGLPGGAQSFQSFANLVFFFYPGNSRLFIRQIWGKQN